MKTLACAHLLRRAAVFVCLVGLAAYGQVPLINWHGVVNAASNLEPSLPNGALAQGSMFVVYGSNLGPAILEIVSSFPLPTAAGLGGTTVRLRSGTAEIHCIMIYTSARQVAAIVPSSTPVGPATLSVTYKQQTVTAPVQIVQRSFGIFTLSQNGAGAAVVQNVDAATSATPLNTRRSPARPGQLAVLWGTGLGPVSGNEAAVPLPGEMALPDMDVFVGPRPARITYRGRSGCCAGLDQIVFTVPADAPVGCAVPVAVRTGKVTSNFATMAISSDGGPCNDTFSHGDELNRSQGGLRAGRVLFSTLTPILKGQLGSTILDVPYMMDLGSAAFENFSAVAIDRTSAVWGIPPEGTCAVETSGDTNDRPATPRIPLEGLSAGQQLTLTLNGTDKKNMTEGYRGWYTGLLGGYTQVVIPPPPLWLKAGAYELDNGTGATGAASVGPFRARFSIADDSDVRWVNRDSITTIDREQSLTIEVSNSDPVRSIYVWGSSASVGVLSSFACTEPGSATKVVVPPFVLQSLFAADNMNAMLLVGSVSPPVKFTAPGLDLGSILRTKMTGKSVEVK